MNAQQYYRAAVWLPLLVPAVTVGLVHGLGMQPTSGLLIALVQVLLISGTYGVVPYVLLALCATWWIGRRPESEIRRQALTTPWWLVGIWTLCALVVGMRANDSDLFAGLLSLGTVVMLPLGYAYVGLVLLLRRQLVADTVADGEVRMHAEQL